MNITEILKTDSISGSRIIINNNFKTIQDNIGDIDKFFYTPDNSTSRVAMKFPSNSWLDVDEIRTNKIKAKNKLRFAIPKDANEIIFFEVDTTTGHIFLLNDKNELLLDANEALIKASQGYVNIQSVANNLLKNKTFTDAIDAAAVAAAGSQLLQDEVVTNIINDPRITTKINNAVNNNIESVLTAFLDSDEFKDKVNALIDEHVMPTPTIYTVVANVNDDTMGYVSPTTKEVEAGKTISLKATAYTGFNFVRWSNGQTNQKITLTVNDNIEITAIFEAVVVEKYTLTATVSPDRSGSIDGIPSDPVDKGAYVELRAKANKGFNFVNWTKEGQAVGKDTSIGWYVNENTELVANFEKSKVTFTIGIEGETFTLIDKSTGTPTELLPGGSDEITLSAEKINTLFGITDPTKFALIYKDKSKNDIEIKDNTEKVIHYIDAQPVLDIKVTEFGTREVKYFFTRHKNEGGGDDVTPEPVTTEVGG